MKDFRDFGEFDFTFDPELEGMTEEPTSMDEISGNLGVFLPNTEGRTEFLPPDPEKVPQIENAIDQSSDAYAQRSPEDRTRELFAQMRPQRAILRAIMNAASEPISESNLEEIVNEVRTRKFSVYSTATICHMMETAGAIQRVTDTGEPYDSVEAVPDIVEIDGVEYYEPTTPPEVHWLATEAGLAIMAENKPLERIEELFEKEADYLKIYKRVLTLASEEGGTTMPKLSAAVDSDPLIAEPTRVFFVQHFTDLLENRDAIEWQGSTWAVTEVGRAALDKLAEVEDDFAGEEQEKSFAVAAETDGIKW